MILVHPTQCYCPVRLRALERQTGLLATINDGRVVLVPRPVQTVTPTPFRRPSDESAVPAA